MSFYTNGKGSNMKRVAAAHLIFNKKLPKESFYDPQTKAVVSVNTVFQIWTKGKGESIFKDYDISKYVNIFTCCSAPDRYCGLGRGRHYDCYIASTFYGKKINIVKSFDEVAYGSGYGLIIKEKKQEILNILQQTDWTKYCSDATNHCKHIRMYHIKKALIDNGLNKICTRQVMDC